MAGIKMNFPNEEGEMLSALLEKPDSPPLAYAIFAHCQH